VITGRTAVYGLIGHPVGHSRSPEMQNAAFIDARIDATYVALLVQPERVAEAVVGAHALGFEGLNVTIPHKQAIPALCVHVDAVAAAVGAVNTLRRAATGWEGFNTDAPACLAHLEAAGIRRGARALVLGAGGAARASAWALLKAGATVRVAGRRADAAREVVQGLGPATAPGAAIPQVLPWSDLAAECRAADVIVNATSVGLPGRQAALPDVTFRKEQLAVEWVTGQTAFVRAARAAGARAVTGEQLLVRQGALAFTLWTGRPAPEAVMTAAIAPPAGSKP
jgi:shikimate dehydrogenase